MHSGGGAFGIGRLLASGPVEIGTRRARAARLAPTRVAVGIASAMAALALALPAAAAAAPSPEPYGSGDAGGFRNVLPSGENGLDNAAQLAEFELNGTTPPHFADQLPLYANLIHGSPTLTHEQIGEYFKDATFGVQEGDVESTVSPRSDVTIQRDKGFGVPHVYGSTRAGVMFGAGYAAAQDRLFLMDVLRHTGRAELSSFAGGSAGDRAMDRTQWMIAPYTEADLESQIANAPRALRREGRTGGRRRRRIRRRHQRLHPAGAARPDEAAGRVRRAREGADHVEADRRDRRGVADRRHLRQGRRGRGSLGADGRGLRSPLRPQGRKEGVARLPRAERPRSADDRLQALRLRDRQSHSPKPDLRCPTRGASASSQTAHRTAPVSGRRENRHALAAADPGRRLDRLAAAEGRAAGPGAVLELGAREQVAVDERPLDRRDGPAGRLLQPADPARGGPPRWRASTPAAPPSPGSTSTSSSATAATTRGARRRRRPTTSTRSPRCSARTKRTISTRASACRWKSSNGRTAGRRRRPNPKRLPARKRSPSTAPCTGSSTRAARSRAKTSRSSAPARPTSTRPTPRSASLSSTNPAS